MRKTKFKEGQVITFNHTTEKFEEGKQYIVIDVWEEQPYWNQYNRQTSYENRISIQELNSDGTYNENGKKSSFTTAFVYSGNISEDDVTIIKEMKKTYI